MTTDEKVLHVAGKVYKIGQHVNKADLYIKKVTAFHDLIDKRIVNLTTYVNDRLTIQDKNIKLIDNRIDELSSCYHSLNENIGNIISLADQEVSVRDSQGIASNIKIKDLMALTYETIRMGGIHDISCIAKFKAFEEEHDSIKNLGKWGANFDVFWKWCIRIGTIILILFILFKYIPVKEENVDLIKSVIMLNQKLSINEQTLKILEDHTRGIKTITDTLK